MNKVLEKDALAETYKDMEKLIHKIIWRFIKDYDIADYDEILSEANFIFLNAMKTYDEKKGSVTTHLTHQITWRLRTFFKKQCQQRERIHTTTIHSMCFLKAPSSETSMIDILDEVGDDAKTLIDLVLETPVDFMNAIRPSTRNLRTSMKRHSTKILGWTKRHYKETFEEVTNAL